MYNILRFVKPTNNGYKLIICYFIYPIKASLEIHAIAMKRYALSDESRDLLRGYHATPEKKGKWGNFFLIKCLGKNILKISIFIENFEKIVQFGAF